MFRRFRGVVSGLGVCIWMSASVCQGQVLIDCERVDTWYQQIANLKVEAGANTAYGPNARDSDSTFLQYHETFLYWAGAADAVAGDNEGHSQMTVQVQNLIPWGTIVEVPQVQLAIGTISTADADASDPQGRAWGEWNINSESSWIDLPTMAQGRFEVLGNNQTGLLDGLMTIIITIGPTAGDWEFDHTEVTDEWQIECGSSRLVGNRPTSNDGWNVSGTLYNNGGSQTVNQFWPDNVNTIIGVDEPVATGDQEDVAVVIPRIEADCEAANTGPTHSKMLTSWSFTSSFRVIAD